MSESHRLVVDRHEGDRTIVLVDGTDFVDIPRWMLPPGVGGDDVIIVRVDTEADRAVITLSRDPEATARARDDARAAIERLKQRDPGGDMRL